MPPFLPQLAPLVQGTQITNDWYIPLQQLTQQAITATGTITPGSTTIFVTNNTVEAGPPITAIADAELIAWLGL
jgi:hypothetical protein